MTTKRETNKELSRIIKDIRQQINEGFRDLGHSAELQGGFDDGEEEIYTITLQMSKKGKTTE